MLLSYIEKKQRRRKEMKKKNKYEVVVVKKGIKIKLIVAEGFCQNNPNAWLESIKEIKG
jgi:hypothetical protein